MIKESVTIEIALGLHARPIMHIVSSLKELDVRVTATCEDKKANLSSIMDAMLLAAAYGKVIDLEADGPDAEKAIEAVKKVLATKEF